MFRMAALLFAVQWKTERGYIRTVPRSLTIVQAHGASNGLQKRHSTPHSRTMRWASFSPDIVTDTLELRRNPKGGSMRRLGTMGSVYAMLNFCLGDGGLEERFDQ